MDNNEFLKEQLDLIKKKQIDLLSGKMLQIFVLAMVKSQSTAIQFEKGPNYF